MKILLSFLSFIFLFSDVFAKDEVGIGFYEGINPAQTITNNNANINKAIASDSRVAEDRYYGYKFRESGFFVAPEVFMKNGSNLTAQKSFSFSTNSNNQQSNQNLGASAGVTYDVKANIGYEFNRYFSGFVSYGLGSLAYNPNQKTITVGSNLVNNNVIGIGSQINLSDSFGVKLIYTQQQLNSGANSGNQVKSDTVKLGTVYSF